MFPPARVLHPATFAILAGALVLPACGQNSGKAPTHVLRLQSELKRPYISMRAADAPAGSEYDRVPLDLWGPFRWQVTFGVFDPARAAGLEQTYFGTELDARGSEHEDYYGIYAHLQDGGVYVYVEYEESGGGTQSLSGRTYVGVVALDAVIEHDGTDLHFLVRPRGSADPYDEIGTLPLSPQPYPLNPGFGTFDFTGDAEVGFDLMRVVSNSAAPAPVDEAHAAFNAIFGAIDPLAEARYALTAAVPDPDAAAAHILAAGPKLDAANAAVAAISKTTAPRKKTRKSRAAIRKAKRRLARNRRRLAQRGAAAAAQVLKDLSASYFTLAQAADAILPQDLRDSLPGDHHSLK